MAATEIGMLFLDQLRIHRFTPPLADLFNVTLSDRGRAIGDFTHHLDYNRLKTTPGRFWLSWPSVSVRYAAKRTAGIWSASAPTAPWTTRSLAWWSPLWTSPSASERRRKSASPGCMPKASSKPSTRHCWS
ncbi:MAG: PAS domain-containing protein [Anaerolineales bacterium]|nr:PAS domain-containing protein [Anaerolineales bacterium]